VSTAPPACATPPDGLICADPAPLTYAVVLDVIDGDTFDALVDGSEERVRLFGVDTPERGDPCYREATDALARLIGGDVRLRADARNRDSNGRLLRYVYTPEGRSIDAALISDGMAVAWTRDGALRDGMVALEQSARDAHRGCLWQ
jgi:micrococcal nuclease